MTLYSQVGCPMCDQLKRVLREDEREFVEETDYAVLRDKGISHVPMLETDEGLLLNMKEALAYLGGKSYAR